MSFNLEEFLRDFVYRWDNNAAQSLYPKQLPVSSINFTLTVFHGADYEEHFFQRLEAVYFADETVLLERIRSRNIFRKSNIAKNDLHQDDQLSALAYFIERLALKTDFEFNETLYSPEELIKPLPVQVNLSDFVEVLASKRNRHIQLRYPRKFPFTLNEIVDEIYRKKQERSFIDPNAAYNSYDGRYLIEEDNNQSIQYKVFYRERGGIGSSKYFTSLRDALICFLQGEFRLGQTHCVLEFLS